MAVILWLLTQDVDLLKVEETLLAAPSLRLEADWEIPAGLDVDAERGTLSIRMAPGDKVAVRVRRNDVDLFWLVSDGTRVSLRQPEQKAVVSDVLPGLTSRVLKTFVRRGFRGAKALGVELGRVAKEPRAVPRWDVDGVRAEPGQVTLGWPAWTLRFDPLSGRLLKTVAMTAEPPINRSRPRPVTTTYKVWEPDAKHSEDAFALPKD